MYLPNSKFKTVYRFTVPIINYKNVYIIMYILYTKDIVYNL